MVCGMEHAPVRSLEHEPELTLREHLRRISKIGRGKSKARSPEVCRRAQRASCEAKRAKKIEAAKKYLAGLSKVGVPVRR
jgi:hypothetical protein